MDKNDGLLKLIDVKKKKKKQVHTEEVNCNADLKKHSALTTFKTTGKKLPLPVLKAVQAIYAKEQNILRETFRKEALNIIQNIFPEEEVQNIMTDLYKNKTVEFKNKNINFNKLPEFVTTALRNRLDGITWEMLDKKTREHLFFELNENLLTRLAISYSEPESDLVMEFFDAKNQALGYSDKQNEFATQPFRSIELKTNEQLNELLYEIKKYCKYITVSKLKGHQQLDYSLFAKTLGVNPTRFKEDLEKAMKVTFEFNYINKKNLNVDIKSVMLSTVKFTEGPTATFLEYEIPTEILKVLLLPEAFIDMKEDITFKLTNTYAYDLYQFLKDHLLKGEVTITKVELKEFLNIPKKAMESKYELQKRVLIPAMSDINMYTDICFSYELIPEIRWKHIKFIISNNEKYKNSEVTVVRKVKETKKSYVDNERIIKAIEKAKRNIYVSRAMKKIVYTKIDSMYNQYGEKFVVFILNELYKSLNKNIETTLVQYINGMIKNIKEEAKKDKKRLTKKMLEETLNSKMKSISEDIIPNFKTKQDVEVYLTGLSECLFKTQIKKEEAAKLRIELLKFDKTDEFIKSVLAKYFEIK